MRRIETLAAPERGLFVPDQTDLYLRPVDIELDPMERGEVGGDSDRLLGGGPHRFRRVEVILRSPARIVGFSGSIDSLREWSLAAGCQDEFDAAMFKLTRRQGQLAGVAGDLPVVMGIVNVTDDSFSDGADRRDPSVAVSHAHALIAAGADILDIGGESTRPGANRISRSEEIDRVVPVIEQSIGFGVPISIDTSKAPVMEAALSAGASIINDVTALTGDPESLGVAARAKVPVILMHMRGAPRTMQDEPRYDCAPLDVYDYLSNRVAACDRVGLAPTNLVVDPGIGFGKDDAHNVAILARIGLLHGLGAPVMLGASRKSMIGRLSRNEPPNDRLGGSIALGLGAVDQGVRILRVHDVAATKQALLLRQAVLDARRR
jgi:dihydropteroate synthase